MKIITDNEIHQFNQKGFLIKKIFLKNHLFKKFLKKLISLNQEIKLKKLIDILEKV